MATELSSDAVRRYRRQETSARGNSTSQSRWWELTEPLSAAVAEAEADRYDITLHIS